MLNLLPISINELYLSRYKNLLANSRVNLNEYYEMHHILPKCMGGDDAESNLIALTAREHFLAHWMLWKAYQTHELAYGFYLMSVNNKNHFGRKGHQLTSKVYTKLKQHMSQNQKALNKTRWENPEWAEKMRKILSKAATTPLERKRRSENALKYNTIYKEKRSKAHKARWQDPEWATNARQKMIENSPKRLAIIIDGEEFASAKLVAAKYNITMPAVRYRINSTSPQFAGWRYK